MRLTNFIIGCILLTLTILPLKSSFASIGEVTLHEGNGVIDRKDGEQGIVVQKDLDVFSYDTVKTVNGDTNNFLVDIDGDGDSAGHTYIHTHTGSIADVDITQSGIYDNMITLTTSGDNHNIDIIQRD